MILDHEKLKGNQVKLKKKMDEQDASQLTVENKINSDLILQETESEKVISKDNSESTLEVYAEPGTENEVITIVEQETDEVYIYDRSEFEDAPAENSDEYIQVCDSNNEFEEVNISEEKDVIVDGIEEEEGKEKKEELKQGVEEGKVEQDLEFKGTKRENAEGEEGQSKNFKNVILEDWEIEVPHVMEKHDSENITETAVIAEEPQEVISYNIENTAIEKMVEPEMIGVNDDMKKENLDSQNEQNLGDDQKKNSEEREPLTMENENPNFEKSVPTQNSKQETSLQSQNENVLVSHNENVNVKDVITPQLVEKRLEALKCPKSVTKEEIVKILDDSSERVIRPIVGGKDLFFSIELTKRLNQKLSLGKGKTSDTGEKGNDNDSCNNNNTVDDRQKIIEILEADDIKDWKSTPSKSDLSPKENGNDMEIIKAIKSMEEVDSKIKTSMKTPRKTPLKKLRTMDKEMERTLALQQLREEFPSTRKRSRTTKKVNHIPFLASTVLEKAMTSPEVTTALKPGPPKRRPCYLPDNVTYSKSEDNTEAVKFKNKESVSQLDANGAKSCSDLGESDLELPNNSIPNPIVKTYSVKRKSTDTESDIKTTLEAVAKALNESSEKISESKPKKQKTVTKENKNNKILIKKKRKIKQGLKSDKKMKSELEKLLGDEGAVRMLYDTQHSDMNSAALKKTKFKTTSGLRKDLVLKTKLVKNAVMRLSGVGTDGVVLRGKRRSICQPVLTNQEEEPLFASTPNIVLYKPKKKQRAEASRILYRHSSSESFDSSEGYRRSSFDQDGLNLESTGNAQAEESELVVTATEKTPFRGRPKKAKIMKKRLKINEAKQKKTGKDKGNTVNLNTDSISSGGSKLNLSNVPIRKSCRPRVISKKYSIWSSTSMDSLSVESLGLKKLKKASTELGKKLNCKELTILQYEHLVQIVLTPTTTVLKNSLNHEVLQELVYVFSYLSEDDSCRVVLISSRGSTFCQGIDINRIISFNENEKKKGVLQLIKAITEFVTCLARFEKPVIAGVQGSAVGFGVTLLPYCDLIISSDTASFYTPYVKLGQAPEGAPIHTFPHINRQLVSELLFKSHKITAADALKLGLVTQVIPEERFEEDLIMISRNMASQPVQGIQSIKFLLRTSEQRDVSEALQVEGQLLEEHWNSPECLNNMIKFLNSGELQLKHNVNG